MSFEAALTPAAAVLVTRVLDFRVRFPSGLGDFAARDVLGGSVADVTAADAPGTGISGAQAAKAAEEEAGAGRVDAGAEARAARSALDDTGG